MTSIHSSSAQLRDDRKIKSFLLEYQILSHCSLKGILYHRRGLRPRQAIVPVA